VWNCRTVGEEAFPAPSIGGAHGAHAHRHDGARSRFGGAGGLQPHRCPRPAQASLYSGEHAVDWSELLRRLREAIAETHEIAAHGNQAVLTTAADADQVASWLRAPCGLVSPCFRWPVHRPLQGCGSACPTSRGANRFGELHGTHLVGHTAWRLSQP